MSASARGFLLVVSAPSGAGKTSLVAALVARDAGLRVSVSHTTRPRRPSERNGADYHFVDRGTFEAMRARAEFLEDALVFGNYYGTSRATVERELAAGHDVLLEIDWQGARQIRASFAAAATVFILPPSRSTLIERLRKRGQDDERVIGERMREAEGEMSHWAEFDYVVVNDDFETAVADLLAIVRAERLRRERQSERHQTLISDLLSAGEAIQ
jgi:guanylate kinase